MAKYERRQRPGVMLYHDDLAYLSVFDAVEVKEIICFFTEASKALATGEAVPPLPELSGAAAITCRNMLEKLIRDHGKYQNTCEKRSNSSNDTKGDLSRLKQDEVDNGTLTELNLALTERNVAEVVAKSDDRDLLTVSDEEVKQYRDNLAAIEDAAKGIGLPFAAADCQLAEQLMEEYSAGWVLEAIRRAQDRNRTWGVVKGILRSWKDKGGIDDARHQQSAGGNHKPLHGAGGQERPYDLSSRYL